MERLPTFRYHPDPIGTGSLEGSDRKCVCCGRARGYIYVEPVFSEQDLHDQICPWCIASGAAFLGSAGARELTLKWHRAIPAIRAASSFSDEEWPEVFESLDKVSSPTAYVFKCLHCGRLGGYLDFD